MSSTISSIAIVLFEAMCCKIFFRTIMTEKRILKNIFFNYCVILLSIAVPGFAISILTENVWVKSIAIIFLFFSVTCILYNGKLLICFSSSIILYSVIVALDYFAILSLMTIFSTLTNLILNEKIIFPFAVMTSKLLLFINIVIFNKIIYRNKFIQFVAKRDWAILIMQSIISLLAFVALIELCANLKEIPKIVIFAAIALLFSSLLVFGFMETAARREADIREKAIIQKQLDIEMSCVASLKNSYDSQMRIMHDFKNHMNVIFHMLNNKNYDNALDYTKNLSGEIYYSLYRIKTNNDTIDIVLNQKDQLALQKGIIMDIQSGDLLILNIPPEELVIILSNVLDNAIEACEKVSTKKVISVKLIIEKDIFIFSVINPVKDPVKIIGNKIHTSKEDPTIHGLGLQNVDLCLGRCNGDYEINCNCQEFQFTAFIRLSDY